MGGVFLVLALLYLSDRLTAKRPGLFARLSEKKTEWLLFFGSFLILFLLNDKEFVWYNNYSYLSDALLHGRLWVDGMPEYLESVRFGGHTYMHFAPGPSLLCLPFVAVFGVNGFNIAWLSLLLGAGNTPLFYRVLRQLGIGRGRRERLWCALFATFGTVHCFLAAVGHSWFLGHVSSWFFLLLGIMFLTRNEASRGRDVFLAGLFYGLAVTCRMANLPGAVFFGGYLLLKRRKRDLIKTLLLFALGAAVFGGLYMAYDWARYGTIMDKGYNLTHLKDMQRTLYDRMQLFGKREDQKVFLAAAEKEHGGPLSLSHVPYNLWSVFCLMPSVSAESPYIVPTLAGVSLTAISPALFFFVRAPYRKEALTRFLLAAAVLCAIPFLMNYGNGFAQFGMRYAMDFLPYLVLLACMGLTRKPLNAPKKLLILFCVFWNVWGPVFWRFFYL